MRKLIVSVLLMGLVVPAVALADRPPSPGKSAQAPGHTGNAGKSAPQVLYVLRGTVTSFTPGTSIAITVLGANHFRSVLKTHSLTIPVNGSTRVVFDSDGQLTSGETALVKVRAPKRISPADLATVTAALQAHTAFQIVDLGTPT
jgi:hypothetical protein